MSKSITDEVKGDTWNPNDIGGGDIKKDFIARCHVEVGGGGFLRFPFPHDKKGRNWLDERLMSDFLEQSIQKSIKAERRLFVFKLIKLLSKMQYKIKSPHLYNYQTKKAYNRALEDVSKLLSDLSQKEEIWGSAGSGEDLPKHHTLKDFKKGYLPHTLCLVGAMCESCGDNLSQK